jgi:hypothetical protein
MAGLVEDEDEWTRRLRISKERRMSKQPNGPNRKVDFASSQRRGDQADDGDISIGDGPQIYAPSQKGKTIAHANNEDSPDAAAGAYPMNDEDKSIKENKYENLSKSYDCVSIIGKKWGDTIGEHIELDVEEINLNLGSILTAFLKPEKDLAKKDADQLAKQLEKIDEYNDVIKDAGNYCFAYGSDWNTYIKNSLICKTKTIVKAESEIETVGISMLLANVFLLFPTANYLVIACRADNNFYNQAKDDPTKSYSTTKNSKSNVNGRYSDSQDGGADINFGSLSNENYTQEGGAPTNFGLTVDYTVEKYLNTLTPQARQQDGTFTGKTDGYNYGKMPGGKEGDAAQNLRNLVKIMIKHMGEPGSGMTAFMDLRQSGSEKMADMDLHVYEIKRNDQLENKLFASENYFTNIVNINFPDSNRVLTFGSIKAPAQFLQIDKSGWFKSLLGNSTQDVEKAARKAVLDPSLKKNKQT